MFYYNKQNIKIDIITPWESSVTGSKPQSNILKNGQNLYGVHAAGGTNNLGTIYEVEPLSGDVQVLHHFENPFRTSWQHFNN